MTEKYKVTGMSCAACSARVEKAVRALEGVSECSVNLLTGDMTVVGEATRETVRNAVVSAGYGINDAPVSEKNDNSEKKELNKETKKLLVRLFVSVGLCLVLMCFSMGHMIGLDLWGLPAVYNAATQMILAATVMLINRKFFINGAKGVIHGAPNMDTLVALGSLASFGYSTAVFIAMLCEALAGGDGMHYLHDLYFESAAMILALITVGKMLESRAKGKTADAIEGLMSLRGKWATLLVDGEERTVSVDDIKIGDTIVVKPGESIPTDSEIIGGSSTLDESMLTGESLPRDVFEGDKVYGGTINRSGHLILRALEVGEGTVLSSIINMVREASATKAPIAKLADKVSGIFVPAVMSISLITLGGWLMVGESFGFAIARAISVLVISCPCALGLATPVAIMVGSGVGAKHGVLFKNAAAIEESGRVNIAVFDKTGTLTVGEPSVTDVIADDISELLHTAYSLEYASEHPLARAVVRYAEDKSLARDEVKDFVALPGRGVYGKIGEYECYGVSVSRAEELAELDCEVKENAEKLSGEGKTPIVFIKGGKYIGMLGVADTLRDDAEACVTSLKRMGVRVVMLSGDNETTARAVANRVGIDEVIAGVLPDGKDEVIRALGNDGKVAMIGDGINDAPALTRADVGIAIGRGTDIAIDSADVVVMGSVKEVAYSLSIGRATLRNVKENLFWAFIYNSLGIPLAAGLFGLNLNPMIGAGMMSLSSVSVVLNALRLNLWKPMHKLEKTDICKSILANNNKNEAEEDKENENMTVTVRVEGMMCPHCEARVKKVCEAIDGVVSAAPNHEKGEVVIEMTKDVTDLCKSAIADAGYGV